MRYRVLGRVIRAENAAQSYARRSQHLLRVIAEEARGDVLDFGCGKLRYASALARRARRVTCVDSEIQVSRPQKIGGRTTTVRRHAATRLGRVRVLSTLEFALDRRRYDFLLCANVLSNIPSREARNAVIDLLRERARRAARVLFVSQYRNSSFRVAASLPNARPFLDGWIINSLRGSAYYGVLNGERMAKLARARRLNVLRVWTCGESAYVLASPVGVNEPA